MPIQLSLLLDRTRADTLTDQLVSQLRDAIRFGRVAPGVRLPSSRRLSDQLGIGRNTVVRAYETLEMECFVESRPASGVFAATPPAAPRATIQPPPTTTPIRLSKPARLSFDFAPGMANAALFPLKAWRRQLQSALSNGGANGLTQTGDLFGVPSLRAAIANHLAAARGIVAEPGQIIIVSGASEAIALATRLALPNGGLAAIENPGPRLAATAFQAAGAILYPVPVDENGLIPDDLPARPPALLSLTPSHQYPTGHTLSQPRREQIVAYARRTNCLILEDDRGADFRYEGGAPPAIAALLSDLTLYFGTFSQSLGAGLRLGYLLVPAAMVEAAHTAKILLNGGSPWLEQAALAEMMRIGSYAAHLMRMRAEYRQRRDVLLDALRRNFGDVEVSGETGGLHVFWQLPPGVPDAATVEALGRRARVGVYALDPARVYHTGPGSLSRRGMMLGYAALTPRQIEQGVARLSDAVDDALDGHHIGIADLLMHRPLPTRNRPGGRIKPAPRNHQQPALPVSPATRPTSRLHPGQIRSMSGVPAPVVTGLYHYPIKGLSPQPIPSVRLRAGQPFPFDRLFALARPGGAVTPEEPKWAKKGMFVMLMLDEGLATVQTHLDPETRRLTVRDRDELLLQADLTEPGGRAVVEAFFHRLAPSLRAEPALVQARDGHFMDKPDNVISLINLATLRALEQSWVYPIDRLRFRANIYIDGAPPWSEFDWVGGTIRIGEAVFRADRRNGRCGATNVDPATGRRDLDIPGSLRKAFGHKDLGIYLLARNDATLAVGDAMEAPNAGPLRATPPVAAPTPGGRQAFICRGCYFIYIEAQGLPAAGIDAGTRFADLPAAWRCPDCGTGKETFRSHPP